MENKLTPGYYYQPLFDLLNQEHGIIPLESELADIITIVEKMQHLQQKAPAGPRWVKASERLPNNPDDPFTHYRLHERKVNGNFYQDNDGMMFFEVRGSTHEPYQIGRKSFQYIEWLDESTLAGREEDAVEFAEWAGWDWRRVEGKNMWENQKTLELLKSKDLYERYEKATGKKG